MQQYTVPQFIDVESKIIGPLTTRQFLIMLVTAILLFIFYKIFDFTLFLVTGIVTFMISGIFAFLKVNGQNFHLFLLNLIQTFRKPNIRVWNHRLANYAEKEKQEIKFESTEINKDLKQAQVTELSLIIDTKGRYKGEDNPDVEIKNQ
jgi:hypothetical protein